MPYKPYLIQRAAYIGPRSARNLKPRPLSQVLRLDYMGSSEFEYGTTGQAVRDLHAVLPQLAVRGTGVFADDGREVYVVCEEEWLAPFADWAKSVAGAPRLPVDRGLERIDFWVWMQPKPEVRTRRVGGVLQPVKKDVRLLPFDERDVFQREESRTDFWWDLQRPLASIEPTIAEFDARREKARGSETSA